ncbi:MAG: chromate efflux transporter [Thalassobaculaceae bacterium]|nr:chromate efflux transporter [Thalassobaculaceae bacterium]
MAETTQQDQTPGDQTPDRGSAFEVFAAFAKLGLTAFGGPVAHIGYFRTEFVERRQWLDDGAFVDLVALCQFLPGPASSQVGLALGARRAGPLGALAAWSAFTLPSAILMILAAYGVVALAEGAAASASIQALKIVAVAVVAQAVRQMAGSLAPDPIRATILAAAAALALTLPGVTGQLSAIAIGAFAGLLFCRSLAGRGGAPRPLAIPVPATLGAAMLVLAGVLLALPALVPVPEALATADASYRAGALVFGGGHVVLPLLEADTVETGLVGRDAFLAGYGIAQAVPGPLFTFAAFLGTVADAPMNGVIGGALALVAVFLPGTLLLFGALPFWDRLRGWLPARAAFTGVNAAVVGLLVAVLYDPVATAAIRGPFDVAAAVLAYVLLVVWKAPPWSVVIGYAAGGAALGSAL